MSAAVIKYDRGMSRWEPDARGRLEAAALALYGERGPRDLPHFIRESLDELKAVTAGS
jgi:hypothetical protein